MRVLREGGDYLRDRERRLWWWLAGCAIALGCAALALTSDYWLVALAIVPIIVLLRRITSRLRRVRKGRLGERLVTDLLRQLPATYHIVNDVVLPGAGGNIDHVVIGPCGVVVIETKRLAGTIRCYGDDWYVNGRRCGSVSAQVNRGAATVREFLADRHPEIKTGFVKSITVFTHPLCRLKVNHAKAAVVRYSQLMEVLHSMAHPSRMPPQLAQRLAETLARSQSR